jgi:hypothetical protein
MNSHRFTDAVKSANNPCKRNSQDFQYSNASSPSTGALTLPKLAQRSSPQTEAEVIHFSNEIPATGVEHSTA